MTIAKALKLKNRLIKEITDLTNLATTHNSTEVDNEFRYNVRELLTKLESKMDELVELKTKIHTANLPVYDKIFRMAELKGRIASIRRMDTSEGKTMERFGTGAMVKKVQMNVAEKDEYVTNIQNEIDNLQDELDAFNATTSI